MRKIKWRKRIIDIYIVKEVLMPFLVGVAIIGIIMLSSFLFQLTDYIIIKKIPVPVVLKILLFQLPQIIVQTFPIAILFATMSGMGRLNRENEFTALRMGGISIYRLIIPLLILGILVSALTFFINEKVVPWSNHEAQNLIRRYILKQTMPDIQENTFFQGPEGRLFYVGSFDQRLNTLANIVIYNFPEKSNGFPEIITARKGKVIENKWQLEEGIIHQYSEDGHLTLETQFELMEYELVRELDNFFGEQRNTSEMSRERLKQNIDLFARSGIDVSSLLVDYHLKLSMPLAALIFILVGTPLSLSSRDSRAASIVFTITIVFAYYLVLSLAQSIGKNGGLDPLLAAWLPNIIFAGIGICLLLWQETWQNWLDKLLALFTSFLLVMLFFTPGVSAEGILQIQAADRLEYQGQEGQLELAGDIQGIFEEFHFRADEVVIKLADGSEEVIRDPEEIVVSQGQVSGCEEANPHYYFQAQKLIIYPNDHLEAIHTSFWELNGRLPLFYWPYLYISLKDKSQKIIPELGYSASRGWFVKSTYNYWYDNRLPGKLLLDYYNISGWAGGFEQYLFYEEDLKVGVYYYTQENRTQLPGLFTWEGAVDIYDQRGNWQTDTDIQYTSYQDYSYLRGQAKVNNKSQSQYFNFSSLFRSKDYYTLDEYDDQKLDLDLNYRRDIFNDWQLNFNYNRDYIYNQEDGLQQRWGSKSYLSKDFQDLEVKLTMERYAPQFSSEEEEEEEVSFYRWPELQLAYQPPGDFAYQVQLGRYYEDISKVAAYRSRGSIDFQRQWKLNEKLILSNAQGLSGNLYWPEEEEKWEASIGELPYYLLYQNQIKLTGRLTPNLTWTNNYQFNWQYGETPFKFDRGYKKEVLNSSLYYRSGASSWSLSTGYNLYQQDFYPLQGVLNWQLNPNWRINMGTSYDFDTSSFGDFAFTSKYQQERWQLNTAFKYDLADKSLEELDNQLIYQLDDEWYLELNTALDYEDNTIDQANVLLKKNFHCRQLWFSYDYLDREFTVEYRINLFPEKGVKIGSSEDEPFMFDLGIEELLDFKREG